MLESNSPRNTQPETHQNDEWGGSRDSPFVFVLCFCEALEHGSGLGAEGAISEDFDAAYADHVVFPAPGPPKGGHYILGFP